MVQITLKCHPILILAALILGSSAVEAAEKYEFIGKVVQKDGKPFRRVRPIVFLHSTTTPFSSRTLADLGGTFKFKNLQPGMYTLIITVPRNGELQLTIEVGPSFADSKGRIRRTFEVVRGPLTWPSKSVSTTTLSVPREARQEYRRALEYFAKNDIPRAKNKLKQALEIAPQLSLAWNDLGTIHHMAGDYEEAERHFRKALDLEPDSFSPLVNLGGSLLLANRITEALPINQRAVQQRPDSALAQSQLGRCYFRQGQLEKAERHLKQTKSLDPGHYSYPQLVLAAIYEKQGKVSAMVRECEEFLRLHPDSNLSARIRRQIEIGRAQQEKNPPDHGDGNRKKPPLVRHR